MMRVSPVRASVPISRPGSMRSTTMTLPAVGTIGTSSSRFSVRKGSIVVSGDGRPLIRWKGDFKRLNPTTPTPNQTSLYLGTWETGYDITQALLFPVSGQGRKLDHVR